MFANDCHIFAVMERTLHFDHVILKPEQQIGLHSQSTWELSLVVKGKGNRITGDMSEPFEEGDLALIPPELPHCWKFSPDCGTIENLTVLFSADFLHSVAAVFPEMQEFFVRLAGWDEAIVFSGNTRRTLADCLLQMAVQSEAMRIVSLLRMLVIITECDGQYAAGRKKCKTDAEQRRKDIEVFIVCNFKRSITIDDIARHVGMNRSSLCTFFHRQTGKTVLSYLYGIRFDMACHLLRTSGLAIQQVCYESGFQDVPHFCRMFKRTFGMTPSDYRSANAMKA